MKKILHIVISTLISSKCFGFNTEKYFAFQQVKNSPAIKPLALASSNLSSASPLLNTGSIIWYLIKEGKPILNYENSQATALPIGIKHWTELEFWKPIKTKHQKIIYQNSYGQEVIKFNYQLTLLYGGQLNKQGRYIGYVSIIPNEISVAFMYELSASVEVLSAHNTNNYAQPVAEILLSVKWQVKNPLMNETKTLSYIVNGFGEVIEI